LHSPSLCNDGLKLRWQRVTIAPGDAPQIRLATGRHDVEPLSSAGLDPENELLVGTVGRQLASQQRLQETRFFGCRLARSDFGRHDPFG
jgi:hypothetical protein